MTLHLWLSFIAATTILLLIPGPTVLQCIGDALANQRRQSWSTILGVGTGDAVAMSLSLLGAGALLQTSAKAFTIMKTLGGLYLLYLGARTMVSARKATREGNVLTGREPEAPWVRFARVSTVTMLNPKSILFFVAFVPQFIVSSTGFTQQACLLLATFVTLAMLNAWLYMSLAARLSGRLTSPGGQRSVGYASGSVLLAAGGLTLALKRR